MSAEKPAQKKSVPPSHPPYKEMTFAAIAALKDRKGSSRKAILKYIHENNNGVGDNARIFVNKILKKGVENNAIVQNKGCFKLSDAAKAAANKPAAKKPAAKPKVSTKPKKPAAKTTTKKPAAKKSPKKPAKSPKKLAKKPTSKTPAKKTSAKTVAKKAPAKSKKVTPKKGVKKPSVKKATTKGKKK